jgi:hypothetical protein
LHTSSTVCLDNRLPLDLFNVAINIFFQFLECAIVLCAIGPWYILLTLYNTSFPYITHTLFIQNSA